MKAEDVTDALQLPLTASGCDSLRIAHKPRLLSDIESSYGFNDNAMDHVRGASNLTQTQGKIERWHQALKNASSILNTN